jgi:hypothetical protein
MVTKISEIVSEKLMGVGGVVKDRVVDALVEKELANRQAIVIEAVVKLESLHAALRRIKPDSVLYNLDGTKASESYTKAKLDEKKKLDEQAAKLDKAIESCLTSDKPDFAALKALTDKTSVKPVKDDEADKPAD